MDITNYLSYCIDNKIPVSFSKYGDGEYFCCITKNGGNNCDNDNYTENLKNCLITSFKYIVDNTNNGYIGLWHTNNENAVNYWKSLVNNDIKFAKYHTIINYFLEETDDETNDKVKLLKTIKQSNLKKIIICNDLLIKSKMLLNIDHVVNVPYNNWFDKYFEILMNSLKEIINKDEQYIIITCCGMGAKVVIAELHKLYPNNIYLDFGSAIDEICTKKNSRTINNNYEEYKNIYSDLISNDWDDPKYDYIYTLAKIKMGVHL